MNFRKKKEKEIFENGAHRRIYAVNSHSNTFAVVTNYRFVSVSFLSLFIPIIVVSCNIVGKFAKQIIVYCGFNA